MELLRKSKLIRLKRKSLGNRALTKEIDALIKVIENSNWSNKQEVLQARPDADCVHSDGYYFFNMNVHRTMVLIEFALDLDDEEGDEENGGAEVIWVGSHDEYEKKFKNNKSTIEKWLRTQGRIQ